MGIEVFIFYKKHTEVHVLWNAEWKGLSYFSCGTNQSKEVITLVGKDIDYKENM